MKEQGAGPREHREHRLLDSDCFILREISYRDQRRRRGGHPYVGVGIDVDIDTLPFLELLVSLHMHNSLANESISSYLISLKCFDLFFSHLACQGAPSSCLPLIGYITSESEGQAPLTSAPLSGSEC